LPHLTPGQSLRFVFLPGGEDPDSLIRSQGAEPMRNLLTKAQALADVLWAGETEGREFSTPERRAGLEAELDRLVQSIRDAKIADYYRRDFNERVFNAFKRRKFRPNRGKGPGNGPMDQRVGTVSADVRRSVLANNGPSAMANLNERLLIAFLIREPDFLEQNVETLARRELNDPQLDRVKSELLNVAARHERLDTATIENHLVCQGLGAIAENLKADLVVVASLKEHADATGREVLWERLRAQLEGADSTGLGQLQERHRQAFAEYLERGTDEDWNAVQRLNKEIRAHLERTGNGI